MVVVNNYRYYYRYYDWCDYSFYDSDCCCCCCYLWRNISRDSSREFPLRGGSLHEGFLGGLAGGRLGCIRLLPLRPIPLKRWQGWGCWLCSPISTDREKCSFVCTDNDRTEWVLLSIIFTCTMYTIHIHNEIEIERWWWKKSKAPKIPESESCTNLQYSPYPQQR